MSRGAGWDRDKDRGGRTEKPTRDMGWDRAGVGPVIQEPVGDEQGIPEKRLPCRGKGGSVGWGVGCDRARGWVRGRG